MATKRAWLRRLLLLATIASSIAGAGAATETGLTELSGASFFDTLSQDEREWLAANPDIRLGVDPAWEPFEFIDGEGRYRGMASDYVDLLNGMLGTSMKPLPGLSWAAVIARAEVGEVDVLPCVVTTPQRQAFLNFSDSYLNFPMVIMTRDDATFISGLDDLKGQQIGVVKGYATIDLIQTDYPDQALVEFDTLEAGLEALSVGQIPAFVDNLASIASVIKKRGITNIKVAAQTPFSFNLSFGVRKDWPELLGILNKALAAISDQQADAIRKDWISIKFEYGIDTPYIIRLALLVGLTAGAAFALIFYWNRRLLAEVRQRKAVEGVLENRNKIHEGIAAGADLDHLLTTLIRNVETERANCLCAILLPDRLADTVKRIIAPNLPIEFRLAIEGQPLKHCLTCCEQAVRERRRVVLADVRQDTCWRAHRHDLEPTGMDACWVEPVFSSEDQVIALFVLFREGAGVPDIHASRLLSEMATLSALAIEHHQNVQTLHKLSLAVEHSPNAVMITDASGVIEHVNPQFTEVTGYTSDEVIGRTPSILQSQETEGSIYADLWRTLLAGDEWWGELRNLRKDGSAYWSKEHITPIKDAQDRVSHFVAIMEDITESRLVNQKVTYQASHDALTDLINRREFERIVSEVVEGRGGRSARHALCFLDLDQFKVVNDTAGHAAGDELLRQLARLIQDKLRKSDVLARLGGDEFAILMENCSADQAVAKNDEIRRLIEEYRFAWEDNLFMVRVSIGIAEINGKSISLLDVLKQADMACYAAKEAGRNRIHVFKEDDQQLMERAGEMHTVNRIKLALENDSFMLYVQPIKSIVDAEGPVTYEILLRMLGDDGEILPPGAFLPAAERYNLITQIDHWVVERTFAWIYRHRSQMADIAGISINISGQSLGDDSLLGNIIRHLKTERLPADKIKFEITETAAIANLTNARSFIASLKAFGVEFALDDFGSGLSSFGYLKNLEVDYLKIDGMFVKDMLEDPIDSAMVKSINDIGHVMGMKTIAEFVEHDAILAALARLQVDYAQGYGIGKPVPISDITADHAITEHLSAVRY